MLSEDHISRRNDQFGQMLLVSQVEEAYKLAISFSTVVFVVDFGKFSLAA